MVNINLSTGQTTQTNKKEVVARSGLISTFAALFIVACLYGGLIMWKNNLNGKIAVANAAFKEKSDELTAGRNKDVIDLQNRISLIKNLVKKNNVTLDVLNQVEKTLVSGVYLNSYTADKNAKTLGLECVADNYDAVARQILSFKSSSSFSDVAVKNTGLSSDGKINFSLDLKLN